MILLILIAVVALVIVAGHTFACHCEKRFQTDVFDVTGILTNIAGWSLVVAGTMPHVINLLFLSVGIIILGLQIIHLARRTSIVHSVVAFGFLTVLTGSIALVIALLIAAASSCGKRCRVIVID